MSTINKIYLTLLCVFFSATTQAHNKITAQAWLVADQQGNILAEHNPHQIRSIASITKLITAMVVLDIGQSLDEQVSLSTRYANRLPKNYSLSRAQVLYLALVRSDNRAAQTLCEQYPGGFDACVLAMNTKLTMLGMVNSRVHEPTGLDSRNVSTAHDLVNLVQAASQYPEIVYASRTSEVHIQTTHVAKKSNKSKKHLQTKMMFFPNTNPMVRHSDHGIRVSKTGYTNPAGGCIVMDINDRIVIVLGSRNTKTRIPEAKTLSSVTLWGV